MRPDPTRPSVSATIARLTTLARETGADLVLQRQDGLFGDITLVIHWDNAEGTGLGAIADMPREAHLVYSTEGAPEGRLQVVFVYDPARWVQCVDEGLAEEVADSESRRVVETMQALEGYLLGRRYAYVKPKPRAALD